MLESVPWLVIAAFGASGILAVVAGRAKASGSQQTRIVIRLAGLTYALVAAVIIGLWMREQF